MKNKLLWLASYNIMTGGFNSGSLSLRTPERLALLQEAIKKIKADFIGLIDTYRWSETFTQRELQSLFGYKKSFQITLQDKRISPLAGIAVLSNLPVKRFQSCRLENRNCLKAEVVCKGKIIDIFTVYLDDLKEETRIKQVKALLKLVKPKPTIIMGDLNSVCPEDVPQLKLNWKKFLEAHTDFKKRKDFDSYFTPAFKSFCTARVIPKIRSFGFLEVGAQEGNTFPTPLFLNCPVPYSRIDYIFYNSFLKVKKFQVYKKGIFNKASDHYPVAGQVNLI